MGLLNEMFHHLVCIIESQYPNLTRVLEACSKEKIVTAYKGSTHEDGFLSRIKTVHCLEIKRGDAEFFTEIMVKRGWVIVDVLSEGTKRTLRYSRRKEVISVSLV